ncbi:hypothetical protein DBR45_00290 [Pseudomonas sp. HMWF031]|nr:hypothetical protein DBR45_00290 [Pseudomonas sp. HMWF031]
MLVFSTTVDAKGPLYSRSIIPYKARLKRPVAGSLQWANFSGFKCAPIKILSRARNVLGELMAHQLSLSLFRCSNSESSRTSALPVRYVVTYLDYSAALSLGAGAGDQAISATKAKQQDSLLKRRSFSEARSSANPAIVQP